MPEQNVQNLSGPEVLKLVKFLPCYKAFVSAGNMSCTSARRSAGVTPEDVGRGEETVPNVNQWFATVCETCSVLLTAFAKAFAQPR